MPRYTGHPLVDVGLATITVFNEKKTPEELDISDFEKIGKFLKVIYFDPKWRGLMSIMFQNSAYTQTNISPQKKDAYIETYLHGYRQPHSTEERCVFCSDVALTRNFRQNVPLLTGEGIVNFFPRGQAGLPACGICLLAIQAFLLGSVKCAGRALFVHSDDESITLGFARRFLTENRRFISLQAEPENLSHPKTYFVARLLEVEEERRQAQADDKPCSITAYHLTNYGTNPDIALYHFPYQIVSFLRQAHRAPHAIIWQKIERRAWELAIEKAKGKKRSKEQATKTSDTPQPREGPGRARNYLFEDLFDLPYNAAHFIRTYLLRRAYRRARFAEDPRRFYSLQRELELVSWTLTAIFLKEVMNMDQQRIETIRRVADRLADYVAQSNDMRLFRGLSLSSRYGDLRRVLVMANSNRVKNGSEPLLTFDDFVTVFEFGEDAQRPDWNLARDLVLIRVFEQLHQYGWFKAHADAIAEEEIPEAAEAVKD